jgi:hypothetical protein
MAAPLKTLRTAPDLREAMRELGRRARSAARTLALATKEQKDAALARHGARVARAQW